MSSLPEAQRVRKFLLLYKELDADDGELTRTRKVRRTVISEKYADIIEAIYAGRTEIDVDTVVAFQDGTRQRIRTRLKAIDLPASVWTLAAAEALKASVESESILMDTSLFLQLLVNGLIVGALYGVVGHVLRPDLQGKQVVNFAQGEFLLIGAWGCWWLLTKYQLPFSRRLSRHPRFHDGLRPHPAGRGAAADDRRAGDLGHHGDDRLSIFFQALMKWMFGVSAQPFPPIFADAERERAGPRGRRPFT